MAQPPAEAPVTGTTATDAIPAVNGKRKAEDELERDMGSRPSPGETSALNQEAKTEDNNTAEPEQQQQEEEGQQEAAQATNGEGRQLNEDGTPLTKNQLKRLRKLQAHEAWKQDRKAKRKDKRHEKQARKREEKAAIIAAAEAAGVDPQTMMPPKPEPWRYRPVPIAFIIDCDFESYMRDPEIVSLSSQLTRSYSMNRKSKYQAHLYISSFTGKLKNRFETAMKGTHNNWRNVRLLEGDFMEAAKEAKKVLESEDEDTRGAMIDLIKPSEEGGKDKPVRDEKTTEEQTDEADCDQSIVYLTSESPYTLERLEANTSYVIGGIVDRNREKGLCYGRAKQHKVRTAKLPIGEFMAMNSRYVLTTNQVIEIMAKWLECGDWGEAFLHVIPKRKGGTLKERGASLEGDVEGEEGGEEGDAQEVEAKADDQDAVMADVDASESAKQAEPAQKGEVAAAAN